MKRGEVFPSRWLSAADLPDGDTVVTIDHLEIVSLKNQQSGKDEEKAALFFREDDLKPLIVNATNWRQIEKATGHDDSEEWAGKRIILFATEVEAFGEMKLAIRVRSHAPRVTPKPTANRRPTNAREAADVAADEGSEQEPF